MLPPIVRRFFSSSPIAAPVLLVLAITTLFLGMNPSTRARIVPGSWLGGSGVGGPVSVGKLTPPAAVPADVEVDADTKVYDHKAPAADPKPVPAPPSDDDDRLPAAYAPHFKNRVLPDDLKTVPALAARLGAFLRRPILSYEGARDKNELHCPLAEAQKLISQDTWEREKAFWENDVPATEVTARRAELVKYLAKKVWEGEEVIGKEGTKGIVLTAGNKDTTERVLTVLRVLKEFKVGLPVEVFHYPGEMTDYEQGQAIRKLGAKIVEVKNVQQDRGGWKNWQIKAYAMIQSSFADMIYLDSDNLPLRDPSHLFNAPEYLNNGRAAFWPDLDKYHPTNPMWRIVGQPCTFNEWAFESGQIVFSKAGNGGLNLAALHLAAGMMDDETREFWFRLNSGDKDTFRWAFRILDIPYTMAPRWMSSLGFLEHDGTFCGHTVLQYDLVTPAGLSKPPPLFAHSNLLKHLGGWGGGAEGSPLFSYIKRMVNDDASDSSLNNADMFVRHGGIRGMCVDVRSEDDASGGAGGDGVNRVILESVDDVEGKPFERFNEMFIEAGGKVGGW